MIWFFMFTTVGIAIFAFFLALKRISNIPVIKWVQGSALLGIFGILSFSSF